MKHGSKVTALPSSNKQLLYFPGTQITISSQKVLRSSCNCFPKTPYPPPLITPSTTDENYDMIQMETKLELKRRNSVVDEGRRPVPGNDSQIGLKVGPTLDSISFH